jgi:hypothetical protein
VNARLLAIALVVGMLGMLVWRSELFTVEKRGTRPLPLSLVAAGARRPVTFDASLPLVPVGVERVTAGDGVLLVHYWAPWEHNSGPQAVSLDSLRRTLPPGALHLAVVCFDPYPSVSRYVGRMRLRLPVMLDLRRALVKQLPCPSIPFTYLVDRHGRIAAEQAGEIDWLSPATRATLDQVLAEPKPATPAPHAIL